MAGQDVGGRFERRGMRVAIGSVVVATAIVITLAMMARTDTPPMIELGGSPAAGFAATTEMSGDAAPRADITIWNPVENRFELHDSARFDAGEAAAWRVEVAGDLEAAANRLAGGFGLGPVEATPFDDGGFVAGSTDGSEPSLWVGASGDWSYAAPHGGLQWLCVENELPTSDDDVSRDEIVEEPFGRCEAPDPPAGVPSASQASQLAERLFTDLEVPGELRIGEVHVDEWNAWVQATVLLDGRPSDLSLSASYGGDAQLQYASGTLAVPTRGHVYPTVAADAAVERLQEQAGSWHGLARPMPLPIAEADLQVLPAPGQSDVAPDSSGTPTPDRLAEHEAREASSDELLPVPSGEVEVVTRALVASDPVLMLHIDVHGTPWLLPGYRFTDADGGIWQVLAVTDEYLDLEAPDLVDELHEPAEDAPEEAP